MTEVFDLVYHGGGGFNYNEVWNMDIPKRKFNIKKIKEHLDRLQEAQNNNDKVLTEQTDKSPSATQPTRGLWRGGGGAAAS